MHTEYFLHTWGASVSNVLTYPQVRELLEDDGMFYLQIAGLRRCFQYEDLIWGLFMAKYIFPGADASMPLGWVVGQVNMLAYVLKNI
jgi:hypothetical protein